MLGKVPTYRLLINTGGWLKDMNKDIVQFHINNKVLY